jgi:hypothetical protein
MRRCSGQREQYPAETPLTKRHVSSKRQVAHGKWEGKQEGKSDKRITESKAQQKESTSCCMQKDK